MNAIPTPSLVIDLAVVKRNIERLANYGREHHIGIRPHTKTHKSIRMAKLQLSAGAVGLTVAKLGEAITMSEAGDDLLVAYPALDAWRTQKIATLARTKTLRVGVDSAVAVDAIADAARGAESVVGILVDLDVGLHRTGVQSATKARDLARHVTRTKGVRLDGIMFYPGHVKQPNNEQHDVLSEVSAKLNETLSLWKRDGLQAQIVSGGSSPSAYQSHWVKGITEIRPGTYIYNDMSLVSCNHVKLEDCAAKLVCTVVSDAVPGKFVIDAGSKSLTQDRRTRDPDTAGFGHIVEYPQARIVRLTEEHGEVDASACETKPKPGDRVHVIPNHICPCVNLQSVTWLKDERNELEMTPVDARGQVW